MLEKGVIVAGYRIDGVLGAGGMGVVYEATQRSLDRTVALKVISAELGFDPVFRERFRQEGRIQAALDHPHIVTVYEAGEAGEGGHDLFIAMRLIPGRNLKQLIVAGELDPRRTTSLISQVAGALDTAHAAGLIHRDIKPSNVLVHAERDHAYLADFGATKVRSGVSLTATGQLVGTPDYMSPEQILGQPATERTDIYALGAVLFECFTGRVPYERDADMAVLYAHLNEPVPPVTSYGQGLPAELDDVIRRAMAKEPDARYPTAGELLSDVELALGRGGPKATPSADLPAIPAASLPATTARTQRDRVGADEPAAVGVSTLTPSRAASRGAGGEWAGARVPVRLVAALAFAGAVAVLAAIAIPFTPTYNEWNAFAVFSPIEALGVALAVAGVAGALLTNRVHASPAAGLLLGFGLLTTVGALALLSFVLRRLDTPERVASVLVVPGAIAILAAGLVCARRSLGPGASGRLDGAALGLGIAGAVLSFVSLFVDYDGFSSLMDELAEGESAEFFFGPAAAVAVTVVALVFLASLSRPQFASGLLFAAGAQSALHYLGLIVAAALAVGERGEVRAGGFIGLFGALFVVAAGAAAYRSSKLQAEPSATSRPDRELVSEG